MALPPDPAQPSREDIIARRRAAEEDALLREVDDAVRQDDLASFGQRYGRTLAIAAGVLVIGFGAYLFWESRRDAGYETQSEALVAALDQAQAGNLASIQSAVDPLLADAAPAPGASAALLAAGAAVAQNQPDRAAKLLSDLAADGSAPQPMRDLARLRLVAMRFDSMDKGQVVVQLTPLANPQNPWFGSAGELLAMAYLEQGKRAEAGRLFAQIAQTETVPDGLRSRARQMAGVLGVDAIPNVDSFLRQQRERQQANDAAAGAQAAPAAAPAAPAPPAA